MQIEQSTHAAILARLAHPAFARFAVAMDDVLSAVAELIPRLDLVAPSRLRVTEARPRGVVAILALPGTRSDDYARHLTTALLTDNQVLVAPVTPTQDLVARCLADAVPGAVRIAGDAKPAIPSRIDLVVTLHPRSFQLESAPTRNEVAGPRGAALLCEAYTRRRSYLVRGRSSLRGPRQAA